MRDEPENKGAATPAASREAAVPVPASPETDPTFNDFPEALEFKDPARGQGDEAEPDPDDAAQASTPPTADPAPSWRRWPGDEAPEPGDCVVDTVQACTWTVVAARPVRTGGYAVQFAAVRFGGAEPPTPPRACGPVDPAELAEEAPPEAERFPWDDEPAKALQQASVDATPESRAMRDLCVHTISAPPIMRDLPVECVEPTPPDQADESDDDLADEPDPVRNRPAAPRRPAPDRRRRRG